MRRTALAAVACILHVAACEDDASHVFEGRLFIAERDCLGTPSVIDVVSGGEPSRCAPACVVTASTDGAAAAYVSTTCPPYPPRSDASGSDPRCARALAAFARGDTCLADGGSTHPAPGDAGAD